MKTHWTAADVDALPPEERAAWLSWMHDEGLDQWWISEGTFTEGRLNALIWPPDFFGTLLGLVSPRGYALELCPRTFRLRRPPPVFRPTGEKRGGRR